MEQYRKVLCIERLPDRITDPRDGELLRFSEHLHVLSESNLKGVGYYDFELSRWFVMDYPETTIEWWFEEIDISLDEINELIQPHAITLEHGEKAAQDIFNLLNGE
jgi:hypothetical protein